MSRILPILFNTEMVKAIREGRKTETRRVIKGLIPGDARWGYTAFTPTGCISCRGTFSPGYGEKFFKLPCMQGDILYVRETWSFLYCIDCAGDEVCTKTPAHYGDKDVTGEGCYLYRADYTEKQAKRIVWRPSIHMPKAAARTWLMVKDVRVERLQEITEEQAVAEGAIDNRGFIHAPENEYDEIHSAREHFKKIWDSTVRKSDIDRYGWDTNPWVWVIEFERCER